MSKDEEELYAAAMDELERGIPRLGLWAKAFADADGNENKAKALYLKYRVAQDAPTSVASHVQRPQNQHVVCPGCRCSEWKSLALVHAEGITHVNTSSSGRSTVLGAGSPGVGVGFGWTTNSTSGQHQTEVSKRIQPPVEPQRSWLMGEPSEIAMKQYRYAIKDWNETRVCIRCGTFYLPGQMTDVEREVVRITRENNWK
jgi:hypothetical protein